MIEITAKRREATPQGRTLRILPEQIFYFPDHIDPHQYEVHGYLQGERVDRLKGLSMEHFNSFQFIRESPNAINGKHFIHVLAHRSNENQHTVLILKKRSLN